MLKNNEFLLYLCHPCKATRNSFFICIIAKALLYFFPYKIELL